MRSFEERKAEIFRISEEKIKQKKKNKKRALALCLPLAVCAAVISVAVLQNGGMVSSDKSAGEEDFYLNRIEDNAFPYIKAEISDGENQSSTVTEGSEISGIADMLEGLFNHSESYSKKDATGANSGENGSPNDELASCGTDKSYIIAITHASGEKTVYILQGNTVIKVGEEAEAVIDDAKLSELLEYFGSED